MTQTIPGKSIEAEQISCGSKRVFPTRSAARKAAREGRFESGHTNIEEYKCKVGDHWHIGHRTKVKKREHHARRRRSRYHGH